MRINSLIILLSACGVVFGLSVAARAQDQIVPPQPAPPPIKYIPEAVRARLESARDPKSRLRASLDEADARLQHAEQLTGLQHFDAATAELGVYQALMEDALHSLQELGKTDGRTRDLFKRLEQSLHQHGARIEAMRRISPTDYTANFRAVIKYTQNARDEALKSFFTDMILPEDTSEKLKTPAQKKPEQPELF